MGEFGVSVICSREMLSSISRRLVHDSVKHGY